MEHTPVPYHVGQGWQIKRFIYDAHGQIICETDYVSREPEIAEANARYIVKACNAYLELIKALEDNQEFLRKFVMKFYCRAENPTYEKMKALYIELDEYQRKLFDQINSLKED